MPLPMFALPVALHLVVAASGGEACVSSEQDAHDQLVKNWTTFQVADRSRCVGMMADFDPLAGCSQCFVKAVSARTPQAEPSER